MNDVVFVMANSKLAKKKQPRKPIVINFDDFSSDDEWIMEYEHGENKGLGQDVDKLDLEENLDPIQVGEDETM